MEKMEKIIGVGAAALGLTLASCGVEKREVKYCKPMEIKCVDHQAIGNGFAEVSAEVNVDPDCFKPEGGKITYLAVSPINRRAAPAGDLDSPDNFDGPTLPEGVTEVVRITRNGVYTVTVANNESAEGFKACVQTHDIEPVEKACVGIENARERGLAPNPENEETCMFDASIQTDCLDTYRTTVVDADRNSCLK